MKYYLAPGLIIGFCVAMVLFVTLAPNREQETWEQFVVKHNCKVVEKMQGHAVTVTTFTSNGKVGTGVGRSPDKLAFSCDDGIKYWRNAP